MSGLEGEYRLEEWKVCFMKFIPEKEKLREVLCGLANGYIGLRSSIPYVSDKVSYKGFYCSGLYNRLKTRIRKDLVVENEDIVNLPDWTFLKFGFERNEILNIDREDVEIIEYNQELDIRTGKLKRKIRFRDRNKRETTIEEERVVSMKNKHLAALKIKIVPENWEGDLYVRSGINGSVRNLGVERYRQLANKHLEVLEKGKEGNKIYLVSRTIQSNILIVEVLRQVYGGEIIEEEIVEEKEKIYEVIKARVSKDSPFTLEKHLAFFTSRDRGINNPLLDAFEELDTVKNFDEIYEESRRVWESLWKIADIKIEPVSRQQHILRFNLFHLLQVVNEHLAENDAGIPARGLHGEAYRGHIFWDELFILPIIYLRLPDCGREILKYRCRRLDVARKNARKQGIKGALFPWQSASKGDEVTQQWHLNPISGRWLKDNSYLQRHVNLAIAYNFWKYFEITQDYNFLYNHAAEVILEICRAMADLCSYNEEKKKWEIKGVMGPDEFHDAYPNAEEPGIDNNAYTNLMTVWLFSTAIKLLNKMPRTELEKIKKRISLSEGEVILWKNIMRNMFIPFISHNIIAQFEGYERLKELNWEAYRRKYGDIRRFDRILEAEGDSPNNYKVSKQADALMLFYLFSAEQLTELFNIAGYTFDSKTMIPETINYYLKRTSHGSSLSYVVHSWVLSRLNREESWKFFTEALELDFSGVSKTTHEGLHLGAMASTIDIIQRCYTGLELRENTIFLNPLLPKELEKIKMKVYYRGGWVDLDIRREKTIVGFDAPENIKVEINYKGKRILLKGGTKVSIS